MKKVILVVEIECPAGVADEEFFMAVERLTVDLDDLHRLQGGHGLRVRMEAEKRHREPWSDSPSTTSNVGQTPGKHPDGP